MQLQKAKIVQEYNEKIKVLRSKGEQIQDLIERARKNGADAEMQNILSKWESANMKIFEAYPLDRPTDMSVLEAAIEDVHKPKSVAPPKAKAATRKSNALKEMSVNDYLAAIKDKEEELLLKARGDEAAMAKRRTQF